MLIISEKEIDALATQGPRREFRIEKLPGDRHAEQIARSRCSAFCAEVQGGARSRAARSTATSSRMPCSAWAASLPPRRSSPGACARCPTFVHESNAIPGKANRLNARLVTRVLLGFEECAQHFPDARSARSPARRSAARSSERLAESGGARRVRPRAGPPHAARDGRQPGRARHQSRARRRAAAARRRPLQVIHLTRRGRTRRCCATAYAKAGIPAFVAAFHHRMEEAYSAADFAIAR